MKALIHITVAIVPLALATIQSPAHAGSPEDDYSDAVRKAAITLLDSKIAQGRAKIKEAEVTRTGLMKRYRQAKDAKIQRILRDQAAVQTQLISSTNARIGELISLKARIAKWDPPNPLTSTRDHVGKHTRLSRDRMDRIWKQDPVLNKDGTVSNDRMLTHWRLIRNGIELRPRQGKSFTLKRQEVYVGKDWLGNPIVLVPFMTH